MLYCQFNHDPRSTGTIQNTKMGREELQFEKPVPPAEYLLCRGNQPWVIWKTLNRLRTGVAKTKANMMK